MTSEAHVEMSAEEANSSMSEEYDPRDVQPTIIDALSGQGIAVSDIEKLKAVRGPRGVVGMSGVGTWNDIGELKRIQKLRGSVGNSGPWPKLPA